MIKKRMKGKKHFFSGGGVWNYLCSIANKFSLLGRGSRIENVRFMNFSTIKKEGGVSHFKTKYFKIIKWTKTFKNTGARKNPKSPPP